MRFACPSFPAEFEIPKAWLDEAGTWALTPGASAFLPDGSADDVISLADIAPPHRLTPVPKDFRGFDRDRMVRVLRGLAQGDALPPVDLIRIPRFDPFYAPHSYGLLDSVHRFFASIAAGYEAIPATIREPFL